MTKKTPCLSPTIQLLLVESTTETKYHGSLRAMINKLESKLQRLSHLSVSDKITKLKKVDHSYTEFLIEARKKQLSQTTPRNIIRRPHAFVQNFGSVNLSESDQFNKNLDSTNSLMNATTTIRLC